MNKKPALDIQPYNQKVKPQYLTFLIMLYVTISLIGCAVLYKLVKVGFIIGPGGLLTLPVVLLLEDIIAEIYGYKISRLLLWYILISQLIFTVVVTGIIDAPSPVYWHEQKAYDIVFGSLWKGTPIMLMAIFVGRFLNLYIITKLRIIMNGRYFWMRSVCSSIAGDLITICIFYMLFRANMPFNEKVQLFLSDLSIRAVYAIIGGAPATLAVNFLKKREQIEICDRYTNFNPFKLSLKV